MVEISVIPKSMRRRQWIEQIAPGIFLFILPFTHTTPLRLLCLALSLIVLVASIALNAKRRAAFVAPSPPFLAAVAFWFLVSIVACFSSIEPSYSWGEFRNEVVYPLVAFSVFYWLTDDAGAWRTWRAILLASFCGVSVLAIASYLQDREWLRSSFVGDRNAYSTYVALMFPLLMLTCTRAASSRWRLAAGAALILALVSGGLTLNRNLWFALGAETFVFAILFLVRADKGIRISRRSVLLVGLVIAVFAASFVLVNRERNLALTNDARQAQLNFSNDPRLEIWAYAGQYIRQRPMSGYGYGRGILRNDFRTHFNDPLKWHGHNVVVDYALEAGVPGALAIIVLFAAFYGRSIRLYRSDGRNETRDWQFGACGLAMLVGITIKMMTDDILIRENSLLFWSIFGMMWGLASHRFEGLHEPRLQDA